MKRLIVIILLFSAILAGCEKSSSPQEKKSAPGDYPTTYKKLDSTRIKQSRTEYLAKNQYLHSSLNTFGFCDWDGDPISGGMPPYKGDISESEATAIIKEFVSKNSSETGINIPENLNFSRSSKDIGFAGSILWNFHSQNQRIDDIEIIYSTIIFGLTNKNLTVCLGNWYPDVYIPGIFNLDREKAKSVLIGQEIIYGSFPGPETSKTITENNLNGCSINLKIMPIEFPDKIELRVCWQIYAPDLSYRFYVDVMTGEILKKESLIIY